MRFAMLPDDERAVVEKLTTEWSLSLLLTDVLAGGTAQVATDPIRAIEQELPTEAQGVREYLFWGGSWGVNSLPPDASAAGRVADLMSRENAERDKESSQDLLDVARTPVIRLRRSSWLKDGSLSPGAFQGMARRASDQPAELRSLLGRIERSLVKEANGVGPESLTSDRYQPAIYAFPQAWTWIAAGGRVYPWG